MTRSCKGPITFSSTLSQSTYTFGNFCCEFSGSRWFQIARVKYWRLTRHAVVSSLHRRFEIATKAHLKSPLRSIRVHETTCWYYNWCACWVYVSFYDSTDEQLLLARERRNTSKTKTPVPQKGQLYLFCVRKICVSKASYMILMVTTTKMFSLSKNGVPQRQPIGTFDVCLTRPKLCPTDINLWLTHLSINFAKYGQVRIGSF